MDKGGMDARIQQISYKFIQQMKQLEISNKWELVDDKPVKTLKIEKQGRVIYRGQLQISVSFEELIKYFNDPTYMKKQSEKVIKAEVLHKTGNLYVIRIIIEGVAFVSNRELVAVFTFLQEGNKIYLGNRSFDFPCNPQQDTVRAFANVSGYIIEKVDEKTCKLINISDLDMNGSIPDFIKKSIAGRRAEAMIQIEAKIKASQK